MENTESTETSPQPPQQDQDVPAADEKAPAPRFRVVHGDPVPKNPLPSNSPPTAGSHFPVGNKQAHAALPSRLVSAIPNHLSTGANLVPVIRPLYHIGAQRATPAGTKLMRQGIPANMPPGKTQSQIQQKTIPASTQTITQKIVAAAHQIKAQNTPQRMMTNGNPVQSHGTPQRVIVSQAHGVPQRVVTHGGQVQPQRMMVNGNQVYAIPQRVANGGQIRSQRMMGNGNQVHYQAAPQRVIRSQPYGIPQRMVATTGGQPQRMMINVNQVQPHGTPQRMMMNGSQPHGTPQRIMVNGSQPQHQRLVANGTNAQGVPYYVYRYMKVSPQNASTPTPAAAPTSENSPSLQPLKAKLTVEQVNARKNRLSEIEFLVLMWQTFGTVRIGDLDYNKFPEHVLAERIALRTELQEDAKINK